MNTHLIDLRADTYRTHDLHSTERIWTETNCYVDVWIEVLHSLDLDPLLAAAFTLSTDFEGDQWTFFKYPEADLRRAYGIDVHEMNPWRGVLEHVGEQLSLGRLMTVEADSYFLPDTQGVSYGIEHVKSTIVPNRLDVEERRLGYFHNAGYFELGGDDFDGVFRTGAQAGSGQLPPYTELVRLDKITRREGAEATELALDLLNEHVSRRPTANPIVALEKRMAEDLEWLRDQPPELFHLWAFGTVRQCGASAELCGAFLRWLASRIGPGGAAEHAADHWLSLAAQAKAAQFQVARAARGRRVDLAPTLRQMADSWQLAQNATGALVR